MDNCCFNRPFDDQQQPKVKLEAEAKMTVQSRILNGELELAWSYVLDYENAANPFEERHMAIAAWQRTARVDVEEDEGILSKAEEMRSCGLRSKDALHLACAIRAKCDVFLTTDDGLLRRAGAALGIRLLNPTQFVVEELA